MPDIDLTAPCQFREIPRFEDYRVSDTGRVQSRKGGEWRDLKPLLQKQTGYLAVGLRSGKTVPSYIHRLVLEAFVGPCPPGMECCHADGNRTNNVLSNLRWDTRKGNMADASRHGTTNHGEKNHFAKLSESDVPKILEMDRSGIAHKDIAPLFGITPFQVGNVVAGRSWAHVEGNRKPIVKGERTRGSRNGCAVLDEDKVREIRRRYECGVRKATLAREFGVSKTSIGRVLGGTHWRHVDA